MWTLVENRPSVWPVFQGAVGAGGRLPASKVLWARVCLRVRSTGSPGSVHRPPGRRFGEGRARSAATVRMLYASGVLDASVTTLRVVGSRA